MPTECKKVPWGQHFLVNRQVARKMVTSLLPLKGSILEIGPGRGILTDLLIEYSQTDSLTAVEIDPELCRRLQNRLAGKITVIQADILSLPIKKLFPKKTVTLIGNIPYGISKELFDWIFANRSRIGRCLLMVQREFAEKILARENSPYYHTQGILSHFLFEARKLFEVSPGSFSPQPRVCSSVLLLTKIQKRIGVDVKTFYYFLKVSFASRRKTLANNLQRLWFRQDVVKALEALGISPGIRAEQLSPERLLNLFQNIRKNPGL